MNKEQFFDELCTVQVLYEEVKKILLFAENVDPEGKTYVAIINEHRNALDHVMRCIVNLDRGNHELNEAKEHLYRAGYDAYEILASNLGDDITKNLSKYSSTVISAVFPKYYNEHKPNLLQVKKNLSEARAQKKIDPQTSNKSFSSYFEKVEILMKIHGEVSVYIPELEKETKKIQTGKIKDFFIRGAVIVLLSFAISYLKDYFWKEKDEPIQSVKIISP